MDSPALPIYLDNNATTRVDPRVVEKMLPYFTEGYGNPSSISHSLGWSAERALETAREHVAALIGASPGEVFFTSGATESNNIALFGTAARHREPIILSTPIEHSSVLEPLKELSRRGAKVSMIPVDRAGRLETTALDAAITNETSLVSVIWASNEVGTVQDMTSIAASKHHALLHTDATQAAGKIPIDVRAVPVDLLSISAHKFHGPKGIGALYIRQGLRGRKIAPVSYGGGQEHGMRPGTQNVPAIVGMGEAARLCLEEGSQNAPHLAELRDLIQKTVIEGVLGVVVNGDLQYRLPNSLSMTFPGIDAEELLLQLLDLCLSTGSACESGSGKVSHVLTGLGFSEVEARSTIRLAVSRFTTPQEAAFAAERIVDAARGLNASKT